MRLPEPTLARAGAIRRGRGWRFEPKLDGFRCLTCTHARFRARSRRGWNMTSLQPELEQTLPPDAQLDGELVRKTRREATRCLKRYLARSLHRLLENPPGMT